MLWPYMLCLQCFDNAIPSPVDRQTDTGYILDFNEARDDGVAVASAGPYANHLHLAAGR